MSAPTEILFFERFEYDIQARKKTITIRDKSENSFLIGSEVTAVTLEEKKPFGVLKILDIQPTKFSELTDFHAEQENMTPAELRQVIHEIYPGVEELFVISFELVR